MVTNIWIIKGSRRLSLQDIGYQIHWFYTFRVYLKKESPHPFSYYCTELIHMDKIKCSDHLKKMAKTDFWILSPEDVGAASSFKETLNGFFSKWVPKIKVVQMNFLVFDWDDSFSPDLMFRPFRKKWPRPIFEICPLRTSGQPQTWRRGQKRRVRLTLNS